MGIDPGLRTTGYGVIEAEKGLPNTVHICEAGVIQPDTRASLPERIDKIHRNVSEIIAEYTPQIMVLEKLYAHYKHPVTASLLGHVRGVICLLCAQNHIVFSEHSVKRIRKALIGNGNASKIQTREAVAQTFHLDPNSLTLDASDALALALGFMYMQR
ncbi:MAG: crossover junction endodeoxyribonuclease RuvC [Candidatus Omnitrophota bacterium]